MRNVYINICLSFSHSPSLPPVQQSPTDTLPTAILNTPTNPLEGTHPLKPLDLTPHHNTTLDDFTEDIEELGWNLRAKIYSLLQHLQEGDHEGGGGEMEKLSGRDRVKLAFVCISIFHFSDFAFFLYNSCF